MRTKILVAFVILVGLVLFFMFRSNSGTMKKALDLKADKVNSWTDIFIVSGDDSLQISKQGELWSLNDGLEVSKLKVDMLKDYLSNLSVRYPLTGPKGETVKNSIKQVGTRITAKSEGNETYEVFLQQDHNILYAYRNKAKYPNVLYDSAEADYIFSNDLVNPIFWRNKTLFSLQKESIENVNMVWANNDDSFVISQEDEEIIVKSNNSKVLDNDIAKFYLYEFKHLELSRRISKVDTCIGQKLCDLSIREKLGKNHKIQFYQFLQSGEVSKSELLVNVSESKEWGVVSFIQVDPILRKASFFIKK
ncbi:hypothetical protein [Saccharicrinis aurantiacus]|uniref:hypothetical protein n=1 Tax=Saccharicrinis aurantiacus TaxID=1849719 RepID=UPI00094FA6D5|nr:hypothetical protein [Saccharicrinis aurantiacus]